MNSSLNLLNCALRCRMVTGWSFSGGIQLSNTMMKELERGIQVAKVIMQLPRTYAKRTLDDDPDRNWEIVSDCLQTELANIQ